MAPSIRAGCLAAGAAAGLVAAWLYRAARVRREFALLAEENAAVGRSDPFSLGMLFEILKQGSRTSASTCSGWAVFGGGNLMLTSQLVVIFSEHLHLSAEPADRVAVHRAARHCCRCSSRSGRACSTRDTSSNIARGRAGRWSPRWWCMTLGTWIGDGCRLLWLGAVLLAFAYAGANLGWNLGHNDFASVGRAQHYMGVHVTLTGVRGAIGPPAGILIYQWLESLRPGIGDLFAGAAAGVRDGGRGGFFAHATRDARPSDSRRVGSRMKSRRRAQAVDQRKYSRLVVDGAKQIAVARHAARRRIPGRGFPEAADRRRLDLGQPHALQHAHQRARDEAVAGADAAGGKGVLFNTITVSDGISMGTPGMRYSLVSREVIADSIETVVGAEGFDGFVAIGGCDKNMPGCAMAIARLNRPAVFVYGGTIRPGREAPRHRLGVRSGRRARRRTRHRRGAARRRAHRDPRPGQLRRHVHREHDGVGDRGARVCRCLTARRRKPSSDEKRDDCRRAGAAVVELIKAGITPRDILTKKAFENAITVTIALGGSTNAVLHLLAIAHAARVRLGLQDFTRIGKRVPVLADVRPSGRYLMSELIAIGGIQPLMKRLLDARTAAR